MLTSVLGCVLCAWSVQSADPADGSDLPWVTVRATDPVAAEAGRDPAVFTVSRTGSLAALLPVNYRLEGTARNGIDYENLDGQVILAAGAAKAEIVVRPYDGSGAEPVETVLLELAAGDLYRIGSPSNAVVILLDNDTAASEVTLLQPADHAIFTAPATIHIEAVAIDPQGYIPHVDFFANQEKIGSSTIFFLVAPPKGSPISHQFDWKNAAAGEHALTARARTSQGRDVVSPAIHVVVRSGVPASFVERALPDYYVAGKKLEVRLQAKPPAGTAAYAVEDRPPGGWTVGAISHDGVFDSVLGKVKYGPFMDDMARSLVYEVAPPAGETGVKEFAGWAALGGATVAIGGEYRIGSLSPMPHPADAKPDSYRLTMDEVTAYAAAWKGGVSWPTEPNPIPMAYVTRAAALWRGGESYRFDASAGLPPACWISGAAARIQPAAAADSTEPEWFAGSVICAMPAVYAPGVTANAYLGVVPQAGVVAYAIEEQPPRDWTVIRASDGGTWDPASGRMKWLFQDGQARVVSYEVAPSLGTVGPVRFEGMASFESLAGGMQVPIGGIRLAYPATPSETPEVVSCVRPPAGAANLSFEGRAGVNYVVQASSDLQSWAAIGSAPCVDGLVRFIDQDAAFYLRRFYRLQEASLAEHQPPTACILSPADGTLIDLPAHLLVQVEASDPDNDLLKVELYRNGIKVGERTQSPFIWDLADLPFGRHEFIARAFDGAQGIGTSAPAMVQDQKIECAAAALAGYLGSSKDALAFAGGTFAVWDDASLGCSDGMMYIQIPIPGFSMQFLAGETLYEVRCDANGGGYRLCVPEGNRQAGILLGGCAAP